MKNTHTRNYLTYVCSELERMLNCTAYFSYDDDTDYTIYAKFHEKCLPLICNSELVDQITFICKRKRLNFEIDDFVDSCMVEIKEKFLDRIFYRKVEG